MYFDTLMYLIMDTYNIFWILSLTNVSSEPYITVLKKSSYLTLHGFFFCSIAHAELISCSPLFIPWTEVWTWYARWLVHSICANFMVVYFFNLVDQDDYLAWVLTRECSSTGAWRKIDFAFYMVVLCVRKL